MRHVSVARLRTSALFGAAVLAIALARIATPVEPAHAATVLEERKLPMRFRWVSCGADCKGWVSAVGIVTANTPKDFDDFAAGQANARALAGATVVLDSSGGSVNDAIALGRRWRALGMRTTVGKSLAGKSLPGEPGDGQGARVISGAYCESMCVFLLLSGQTRYVPEGAHVRVHQIWMGDRADDAQAASYTAQDMMIVERDVGRLAKYTFDMGGSGDLLAIALSVPPWEDLYELSSSELQTTHLVTTADVSDVLPAGKAAQTPVAAVTLKPVQDRFTSSVADVEPVGAVAKAPHLVRSTQTAEAVPPATASTAPAAATRP